MHAPWRRLQVRDRLVAAGFVAAAALEALVRHHSQVLLLCGDLVGAAALGSLAVRRTRPLLAVTVIALVDGTGSVAQAVLPSSTTGSTDVIVPILALIFANYSLGAFATRTQLMVGAAETMLLITVVDLTDPTGGQSLASALPFFAIFVVVGPAGAGRLVRGRSALVARLRQQTAQLEQQRHTAAQFERARERVQLAERLQGELVSGLEDLRAGLRRAAGEDDPEGVAAAVEQRARALLADTRKVVVALADLPPAQHPTALPGPAPRRGRAPGRGWAPGQGDRLPWTTLAASALGVGLIFEVSAGHAQLPVPLAVVACLALTAPLILVARAPLMMTALAWAVAAAFTAVVLPLGPTLAGAGVCVLAPFLAALYTARLRAAIGLALCCAGAVATFGPAEALSNAGLLLLAWLAGAALHERTRLVRALEQNNLLLSQQITQLRQTAVYDERAAVARELHDAIGHTMTVVALQAGGARRLARTDPVRATETLRMLDEVVEDGLAELRRGFEMSTLPDEDAFAELLSGARTAGLVVSASLDGLLDDLAPTSRIALYRVVQEALTNVLRHAPGAPTVVQTQSTGGCFEVAVVSHPPPVTPAPRPDAAGGHGLRGMRQRVEACGGQLAWQALPGGGFEVRAQLPLAKVPA